MMTKVIAGRVATVALSPSVSRDRIHRDADHVRRFCRLLDRTPSERSEDKLVFQISMSGRANCCEERKLRTTRAGFPLPSGMGIDDESDQVT